MVVDAAKGVEEQTIKLLEVCVCATPPIIHFHQQNGSRSARPPGSAGRNRSRCWKIKCAPVTWPIGMGKRFSGRLSLAE